MRKSHKIITAALTLAITACQIFNPQQVEAKSSTGATGEWKWEALDAYYYGQRIETSGYYWSQFSRYEEHLDDMMTFIDENGTGASYLFKYVCRMRTAGDLLFKWKYILTNHKYGTCKIYLNTDPQDSNSSKEQNNSSNKKKKSKIVEINGLHANEGFVYQKDLKAGVYTAEVLISVGTNGDPYLPNDWVKSPMLKVDFHSRNSADPLFADYPTGLLVNIVTKENRLKDDNVYDLVSGVTTHLH